MRIFDAHCDVLSKLLERPELDFVHGPEGLDVTLERMLSSGIGVQNFAVYLPQRWSNEFRYVLDSIDLFHERILSLPQMQFIRTKSDLARVTNGDRIGALLSLEGVDSLHGNLAYLRILYHLGVRTVGITWNRANWAADGVLEPRKGGFTAAGTDLIKECNRLGLIMDVSHLSEKGFWELAEATRKPVIASHSNASAISPRLRNLSDAQIGSIVQTGGVMGITFVPPFVSDVQPVSIDRILLHIDHVCALGGKRHIGFGSDFDGIQEWIVGLEHAGHYDKLVNLLLKHYREDDVKLFVFGNWHRFYMDHLPEE
ncbi:membrane dipeptidase [Paenibacillus rhizovicinus]|uniref:Membrane dipeptidase n=1 Tax=Paenibacillus rhizovicinus TaxID=2704463 RepID=A0A6C0NTP5_9BACL|nr:dipeptidase [Paenibacillus rhizovicinus]QHW29589.1 membrane dipeptidase [Paenibacillus rhizovicinus]